jgi:subtilisin family serine protease
MPAQQSNGPVMRRATKRLATIAVISLIAPLALFASGTDSSRAIWVFFEPEMRSANSQPLTAEAQKRRAKAGFISLQHDLYPSETVIEDVLSTGVTLRTRSAWLDAISVQATEYQRAQIERISGVMRTRGVLLGVRKSPVIESKYEIADIDTFAYGVSFAQLDLVGVPELHLAGYTGSGVRVAVFDGGYIGTYEHLGLQHINLVDVQNFVSGGTFIETHDHGTGVISTFATRDSLTYLGVAPEVELLLAVTEDVSDEYPEEEDYFVEALEWAEAMGADLVTASIGYNDWYADEDFDGDTAPVTIACDMAAERGLLVVTSVGNDGAGLLSAPADGDSVLAVGATTLNGGYATFSTQGPTWDGRIKPDIAAPGASVWIVDAETTDSYRTSGGTSYSCPIVAGVCALLLEANPDLLPMDLITALRETGSQAAEPDTLLGWGLISAIDAYNYIMNNVDDDNLAISPASFQLLKVYPNPVNGQATAVVELDRAGLYVLSVNNILGQRVQSQHIQLVKGTNRIPFNLSAYHSGQYYITVSNDTRQLTKRLTVIR